MIMLKIQLHVGDPCLGYAVEWHRHQVGAIRTIQIRPDQLISVTGEQMATAPVQGNSSENRRSRARRLGIRKNDFDPGSIESRTLQSPVKTSCPINVLAAQHRERRRYACHGSSRIADYDVVDTGIGGLQT